MKVVIYANEQELHAIKELGLTLRSISKVLCDSTDEIVCQSYSRCDDCRLSSLEVRDISEYNTDKNA